MSDGVVAFAHQWTGHEHANGTRVVLGHRIAYDLLRRSLRQRADPLRPAANAGDHERQAAPGQDARRCICRVSSSVSG